MRVHCPDRAHSLHNKQWPKASAGTGVCNNQKSLTLSLYRGRLGSNFVCIICHHLSFFYTLYTSFPASMAGVATCVVLWASNFGSEALCKTQDVPQRQ